MPPRGPLLRVLRRSSGLLWASAFLSSCSAEPEPPASATLRLVFPDHAAAVLAAREAFVPAEAGFHLDTAEAAGKLPRPTVVLPRDAGGAVRFRSPGGAEVRVREIGALGESTPVDRAVAHGRAGGTSFWTATDSGVEEWLLLDEGIAHRDRTAAAWQVEGAALRARGEAVELVDEERGTPLLRVTAPRAYAASGRPVAVALRARGSRIELSVDADGEAVLVDPAWESAGVMNVPRGGHTATLLPSGKVLVAGGYHTDDAGAFVRLGSAELYDPATDTWTLARPMHARRGEHSATLLPSGLVLVAGGSDMNAGLDSAEVYDPEANAWVPAPSMRHARAGHTATLLLSGKVLVVGGLSASHPGEDAELYDPTDASWTFTGPMLHPRGRHTATLLPSGEVLLAGGSGEISLLYDPAADAWALTTGPLQHPRDGHTATLLSSGEVLLAGGLGENAPDNTELYDPAAGTWRSTGPMRRLRGHPTATLLPSGEVLATGGMGESFVPLVVTELYDPTAGAWDVAASMSAARSGHTATLLWTGEVLVAGGGDDTVLHPNAERYGLTRGEACTGTSGQSSSGCLSGLPCVDGTCCDAPCPCGTCSTEGRCGDDGSLAKAGTICAPRACADATHSTEPARCTVASSACPEPARVDCVTYRCDQKSKACKTSCASLDDCAPGFVCNLRGHCVPPPSAPIAASGCSAASRPPDPTAVRLLGVLLVGLGAARRRRRAAAAALFANVAAVAGERRAGRA
ncbi:kelch repeat-containing protein [Sorangium sp. So ce1014]|uniref:Kelch repeat-containing protein n=1 Tax=Sorangium sp. So ce1014 TaxID=3133326 RepID=UPI003F647024